MTHTFKHFEGGGTGIRSLLDQYVYLNKLEEALDFRYIEKQCEILGIADFEKENRILCNICVVWVRSVKLRILKFLVQNNFCYNRHIWTRKNLNFLSC